MAREDARLYLNTAEVNRIFSFDIKTKHFNLRLAPFLQWYEA